MHPANLRRFIASGGAALAVVAGGTVHAQTTAPAPTTTPTRVPMLEWDLPTQADAEPGAITIDLTSDANRLWFATRVQNGVAPRLYRMDLRSGKKVNNGQWFSWELDSTGIANGLRKIRSSSDQRYVFVESGTLLQRIDTVNCATTTLPVIATTCPRTTWVHNDATNASGSDPNGPVNPVHGSDVAVDDYNNVYAALAVADPGTGNSFVQRLNPNVSTNNATRWYVGGSAGFCPTSLDSAPCFSGIAIDRRYPDLVYYSEPTGGPDGSGAIGELDTRHNAVRRWTFAALALATGDASVHEPRQLQFDSDGTLWVVTGSGHLVHLDPAKSRMSKHLMPSQNPFKDPFGIAPDGGLIGYTDASLDDSRVGMLMPARRFVFVAASGSPLTPRTFTIPGATIQATRTSGQTPPSPKVVPGQIVRNGDGTFSEAFTGTGLEGVMPLGITPDRSASVGTFFFAVGDPTNLTFNRIARVRLPRQGMHARVERDDDDTDDDGKRADVDEDVDDDGIPNALDADNDNDGIPDIMDDDTDNDGIEDSFDTKDHKETKQTSDQDVAPGAYAEDAFTLNAGTLLVVASAVSADPLLPVKVEVVDAAGNVVASSLSTPGAAVVTFIPPAAGGAYTLRVKNLGVGTATISTKLLTRELWPIGQ
jgi:hypothetical protein